MDFSTFSFSSFKIPENLETLLQTDESEMWECDDFTPFNIIISNVLHKGVEAIHYQVDFSPSDEEFDELNQHIEGIGFDADGYGWTDYMLEYISDSKPTMLPFVFEDSESATCVLYVSEAQYFEPLLTMIEKAIKELARSSPM